jgi:hypothetical protein
MYSEEFIERFWSRVDKKPDSCWLWMGTVQRYGVMKYHKKMYYAHRVSLELHLRRPIVDGMMVAHTPIICHNRLCVNPAHLREATPQENVLDKHLDGTMLFGKDNNKPRSFTQEQIRAIRADTRSQQAIADEYGITQTPVSQIKAKKIYAWVD